MFGRKGSTNPQSGYQMKKHKLKGQLARTGQYLEAQEKKRPSTGVFVGTFALAEAWKSRPPPGNCWGGTWQYQLATWAELQCVPFSGLRGTKAGVLPRSHSVAIVADLEGCRGLAGATSHLVSACRNVRPACWTRVERTPTR